MPLPIRIPLLILTFVVPLPSYGDQPTAGEAVPKSKLVKSAKEHDGSAPTESTTKKLTSPLSTKVGSTSDIGVRFDCLHNSSQSRGSTQNCLRLSGLVFRHESRQSRESTLNLSIDPLGTPSSSLTHLAHINDDPIPSISDSSLGIVTRYALTWQFRNHLVLGLENHGGATHFPNFHQLSLGSRFSYAGWDQAALTARYTMGATKWLEIEVALGNGEGEPLKNLDPQQYSGIRATGRIINGVKLIGGASLDANNVGSESFNWVYGTPDEVVGGFSTTRIALILLLEGSNDYAPGLTASIGIFRSTAKDLDKKIMSIDATKYDDNPNLSLRDLYVEDPNQEKANSVKTEVMDISLRYAILATNFISFNYETRDVGTGQIAFFQDDQGAKHRKISQTGYTLGIGLEVSPALYAILEYHTETYNKLYDRFHYRGESDKTVKSLDLFNARFQYSW